MRTLPHPPGRMKARGFAKCLRRPPSRPHVEPLEARALLSNLLTNGDFEVGDDGFKSQDPDADIAGGYILGRDPGAEEVSPGTDSTFSGWAATVGLDPSPARRLLVDGVPIDPDYAVPARGGSWSQFSAGWNSGGADVATIQVVDLTTHASFAGTVAAAPASNPDGGVLGGTTGATAQGGVAALSGLTLEALGSGCTLSIVGDGPAAAGTEASGVDPVPTGPSFYTVDVAAASGAGSGDAGDLAYVVARADADANPFGSVIRFDPAVFSTPRTITLTSPLVLSQPAGPLAIEGPGAGLLTLSGGDAVQVFRIEAGVGAAISGLTIADGRDPEGGGIWNDGELTIAHVVISGNWAVGRDGDNQGDDGLGGGIYNAGALTIRDAVFQQNAATGGSGRSGGGAGIGGAVYNVGTLTMNEGRFDRNQALGRFGLFGGGGGSGGAIYNGGIATMAHLAMDGNSARVGGNSLGIPGVGSSGGAIHNDGTLTLFDASFTGNGAGGGGAIRSTSVMSLFDVLIAGGDADEGGGVSNTGTALIKGATIRDNRAYGTTWSRYGNRNDSNGGGVANSGSMTIVNATIVGNTAADPYRQARGRGAGIGNSGTLLLLNSTVADNTADEAGGLWTFGSQAVTMTGESLFRSADVGNVGVADGGVFRSLGRNLFSDSPSLPLDPSDLVAVDPLLGPLQDNGGPTPTMALLPGSPALDGGVPVAGVTSDQRGVPRPQGAAPDIGAFESAGLAPAFASLISPTIVYGAAAVTVSGRIAAGAAIPPGEVAVTLGGVAIAAAIDPDTGAFAATFPAAGLHVGPSPYAVAYHYAGAGDFLAADAVGWLAVAPATLAIVAGDVVVPFGADVPPLKAAYVGLVAGDAPADLARPAALATAAVAYALPGRYAIVASGAESADYAISYVDGVLTVAQPAGLRARGGLAFVTSLYRDTLGRAPEPAGLRAWMRRLDDGATPGSIARGIWASREHRSLLLGRGRPGVGPAVAWGRAVYAWRLAARHGV